MKLILSAYLRTLRERDELDVLLPDLLLSMGIVPLSKPQTGTRQFGVDLSAVGKDTDGKDKLFLFVLKKGDIDRQTWDGSGEQSVHPSLNEIFDVYLRSHIAPKYKDHPVKVILGATGDLKEAVQPNWAGYAIARSSNAEFDFWGADRLATLIEQHLLNEHLFQADDRSDLRRTLALIGEPDYSLVDYHKLLLRQLGLSETGELISPAGSSASLMKTITRINLACRLVSRWAINEGDTKTALKVAERTLLWTWRRLLLSPENQRTKLTDTYHTLMQSYFSVAQEYVGKLKPYCLVRDGLSGYTGSSPVFALTVFEHIGLLAGTGLALYYTVPSIYEGAERALLDDIIQSLVGIIVNLPPN